MRGADAVPAPIRRTALRRFARLGIFRPIQRTAAEHVPVAVNVIDAADRRPVFVVVLMAVGK